MLNKVMIIGRLGRDPELRYMQSGAPVCSLRIATDESYTDKEGTKVERTEWHSVSVFQRSAENCNTYLSKGSLVFVEGNLQTRKWQDQQGQDRYSTEIRAQRVQFLDRRGASQDDGGGSGAYAGSGNAGGSGKSANSGDYNAPRGGSKPAPSRDNSQNEDLGPAFPSEASGMDEVPF